MSLTQKKVVRTDAANTSGTGYDLLLGTSATIWRPLRDVVIDDIVQASCGTVANDGDWTIYAGGKQTDWFFTAENLNPANLGKQRLGTGITIKAGTEVQFKWAGQGAAALNYLEILYRGG